MSDRLDLSQDADVSQVVGSSTAQTQVEIHPSETNSYKRHSYNEPSESSVEKKEPEISVSDDVHDHESENEKESSELETDDSENLPLPKEDLDFPEGGTRAWLVVFGSWAAMTGTFGLCNATGYLQAWLAENQLKHMSESNISWIWSIYLFLFFLGGVQVGPLFDAYGLKYVFYPGAIGCIAGVFLTSACKEFYQFVLAFSVLMGASSSLVFTPSVAIVGHWFYRRRGLATGLAATGGACGGVMFPLVMGHLMPRIGFGWTIRVVSFIIVVLMGIALITLRTRIPLNKKKGGSMDLSAFKDMKFTFTTIGVFLIELALFVPITYLTSYCLDHGVNPTFSYQIIALFNASSIFGRAIPGYMADRWGRFNVMIVTAAMCAIMCLALWLPAGRSLPAIIVFSIMLGFWSGTGICLTPVCVSQICKTEDYGKRYGTCYFCASFAVLIGSPIGGAIKQRQHGNYEGLIIFSGVAYAASAALFVLARYKGVGLKPTIKY